MPEEVVDQVMEHAHKSRLNTTVAILVSITATIMAISHVKNENIVQRMHENEAETNDAWAYYQAKSMKQSLAEEGLDRVKLAMGGSQTTSGSIASENGELARQVRAYTEKRDKYERDKQDQEKEARGLIAKHAVLQVHHDQLDLTEALLSIALSLFAITALTQKRWVMWFALVLSAIGLLFGIAAFAGWGWHIEALTKFFG